MLRTYNLPYIYKEFYFFPFALEQKNNLWMNPLPRLIGLLKLDCIENNSDIKA